MDTTERVRALILPELAEHALDLYDLEFVQGTLRVTVDREGGADLEAIGSITRAISRLIDEHDPIPGRFTLEVTSPGLERSLRTPAHFVGAVGETITGKTRPGVEGDRRFRGVLSSADDDGIVVDDDGGETRHLAHDEIDKARTVFDWGPAPKPGARPSGPSPSTKQKAPKR